MWRKRLLAPGLTIEHDKGKNALPGEKTVKAMPARMTQSLARQPEKNGGARQQDKQVNQQGIHSGTRQISMTLAKGLPSLIGMVSTLKPMFLSRSIHSANCRL